MKQRLIAGSLIAVCLGLAGCAPGDWRAEATAQAEAKVRAEISDPSAQFSRVQVTGDDRTGQTCGFVAAAGQAVRFIVYIDGTAGPYVEAGAGQHPIAQDDFNRAWQSDCVSEGYNS